MPSTKRSSLYAPMYSLPAKCLKQPEISVYVAPSCMKYSIPGVVSYSQMALTTLSWVTPL